MGVEQFLRTPALPAHAVGIAIYQVIGSMIGTDSIVFRAIDIGKQNGWVKAGDKVVCVHGMKEATSGSTNSMRVIIA